MSLHKQAVLLLIVNPLNKDQVLTVSRKDDHKLLGLPGGKVEEDETLISGLLREIREELNFEVKPHEVEFVYQALDGGYDTLTYVYTGRLAHTLPQTSWVNSEGALVSWSDAVNLISKQVSPFSEYNLAMFRKFNSSLDFVRFQR